MNKNTFYKIVIALILISNFILIGYIIYTPSHLIDKMRDRRNRDLIIEKLNLTDNQILHYDELIQEHLDELFPVKKELIRLRNNLYLQINTKDSILISKINDSIGNSQKELELVHFRHFSKLRAICTEVQKPKFDEISKDFAVMFSMKKPPRRPR